MNTITGGRVYLIRPPITPRQPTFLTQCIRFGRKMVPFKTNKNLAAQRQSNKIKTRLYASTKDSHKTKSNPLIWMISDHGGALISNNFIDWWLTLIHKYNIGTSLLVANAYHPALVRLRGLLAKQARVMMTDNMTLHEK